MFANNTLDNLNHIEAEELEQAYKEHGVLYASDNETWGVLMEEIEEAKQNMKVVEKSMKNFFESTRTAWADPNERRGCLNVIRHYALLCAAEWCQVAACAKKALAGTRGTKPESEDE